MILVEIKEKKGLFYILEIEDENENQSTFLARQKQLRYIEYLPFDDYIEEKYVNVNLSMPPKLSLWVGSQRFNDTLKEINGDETGESEVYQLFYTKYPSDSPNHLRIFCCWDKKDSIEIVLNHSMEKEKELTNINQLKENSQKELEEAQKKNKTIYVNPKYVGLLIGKEGNNIKKLNSKFGVTILVDNNTKKNEKSEKNDTKPIKVTISGDDGDKVEECAKEINYVEKIFEIPENSVGDFKKRSNKLIEKYKIKNFFVGEEEKKDDEGNVYKAPNVTIIGNSEYIDELYNNEIENYYSYNNSYDNNNYNYNYNSGTYKGGRRNNNNYYSNNYSQNSYKYNNKNYGYYH